MKKTYTINFILGLFLMSIGSLATAQCDVEYGDGYFWGTNGEGAFDGDFGDWTLNVLSSDPTETWEISPDGFPTSPNFSGGTTMITSPSGACGAAHFSFVKHSLADNPNPGSPPYPVYLGELISPTINCSGRENITVEFYQQNHRLNEDCSYAYSTDNGATWITQSADETDLLLPQGQGALTEKVSIPMPAFTNQDSCKFKIVANGDFYYLTIDDFTLKVESTPDLAIDPAWVAGAVCYGTPKAQVIGMPLMADVNNQSAIASTSSVMTANVYNITDPSNTTLEETYSLEFGLITAGTREGQNKVFSKLFTPSSDAPGTYLTEYIINDPLDVNPSNDTATVTFEITDTTYLKVLSPEMAGQTPPDDYLTRNRFAADEKHSYGTSFHVVNGSDFNLESVQLGFAPDDGVAFTSGTVYLDLYSYVDINGDGVIAPTETGTAEITRLGGNEFLVTSATTVLEAAQMTVEILDEDDNKIELEDNTQYIIMMSFDLFDEGFFYDIIYAASGSNRQFYDEPVEYAYDTLQMKSIDGSVARLFTDYDAIEESEMFNNAWGSFFINPKLSYRTTGVNDINDNLNVNVYPTIASDIINIDLDLENTTDVLNLELVSIDGRVILSQTHNNVSKDLKTLDVTNVEAGSYLVNIRTEEGMTSKKVMVIR